MLRGGGHSAGPEAPRPLAGRLVRGLGPVAATALVAGNIIGSGIFVTPAALADVAGPVSLIAWIVVGLGYLCLTTVYADLVGAYPVSGGLQVYAQRAFGDLAGVVTAFLYWTSCIIGNAAFITAFVGYFQVFVPAAAPPLRAFLLAQVLLWTLTLVNVAGVRAGGAVQVVTTIGKLLPLALLAAALLAAGSTDNLHPFAPHGYGTLLPAISLVAWLFLGAESATVPAEEVVGSGRTLRRSAYVGYLLAFTVYLVVAFAVAVGVPSSEIAGSASPLAIAARRVMGAGGEVFITVGALVSTAGILNGWLLVTGRLPFAAARQGIAPSWLGRIHPRTGTPAVSLVVSSSLSGLLVLLYFNRTLFQAYNFIALASTATALVAIGIVCVADLVLLRRDRELFTPAQRRRGPVMAVLGLAIVVLMIAGSGTAVLLCTLAAVAVPVPYALWLRRRPRASSLDPS